MNFWQGTRGIIRALAIVLSVALPLAIAISEADARVGGGSSSGSRGSRTFSAPPAAHLPIHGAGIRFHRSRRRHGFLHLLDQRAERKWLGQEGELLVLRQALVEGFFGVT